jgi:hypothetical protein
MKIIKKVLAATILLSFSHAAFSQSLLDEVYGDLDAQGNKMASGQYSFDAFVECLDDVDGDGIGDGNYIYVDVDFDTVIHSRQNGPTWMFSAQWRQSGTAYSLDDQGNIKDSWRFNGHWKVNETSEDPDWQNRQHLTVVENDIFIANTDAPNLKLTYTREVRWSDGVRIKRASDFSISCLNQ